MNSEISSGIIQKADLWAEQVRADPSFTLADAEELKYHLIDLTEELIESGLVQDEAFLIATSRLGDVSALKDEFEDVNTPILQMRNTILLLSGVMSFFFLYFFISSTTRLLALVLDNLNDNPKWNFVITLTYFSFYILSLIGITIFANLSGTRLNERIEHLKIKPKHTFILFSGILLFFIFDQWFQYLSYGTLKVGYYTASHLYQFFDYMGYILPFVSILCFLVLFHKYHRAGENPVNQPSLSSPVADSRDKVNYLTIDPVHPDDAYDELKRIGLNEEEACMIAHLRSGRNILKKDDKISPAHFNLPRHNLLIIFAGILVYFFFYFLLCSTSKLLFIELQRFQFDTLVSIRRTWSYVLAFHGLFIIFSANQYMLDQNLAQRIKKYHFKPIQLSWLFLATALLAIIDRILLPVMKRASGGDIELKYRVLKIFLISEFTFPLTLSVCFLLLFYKYYTDHVKIGQES
jgi:hypothetical protein